MGGSEEEEREGGKEERRGRKGGRKVGRGGIQCGVSPTCWQTGLLACE